MLLFFDTETNGLPKNRKAPLTDTKNWPRLVQIAWLMYDESNKLITKGNYIIKPEDFHIPAEAVRIHGITTEKALKEGATLSTVLTEFSSAIDEADYLIAHNMNFDEKIVGAEFLRANVKSQLFFKSRICTMKAATDFCRIPGPYGYKWPTLTELHQKLFRSDFKETHHADIDVEICAKCFFELWRLGIIIV